MTVDDALRRLTADLAEDERITREFRENLWDEKAMRAYLGHKDPKSTLRRVEAIRRLLRRHEEAERDSVLSERDAGFEAGLYAALEALAGIYLEGADETGAPNV